jgi:hypothetical protein
VVRRFAAIVFAVVVAALVPAAAPAQDDDGYWDEPAAADEAPVAPGDYDEALAPYGSWVDDPDYGRAWQPAVTIGWAPYVDGYWAETPYGWTWVASEPWGWTFHYGRWGLGRLGWVWVPGTEWGPAWVDWFWDDGFVGWAPLSPFGIVTIESFVFVHERDFCARNLNRLVVDHHFLPDQVVHGWGHRGGENARPPDAHRIERVSGHGVAHFDHRPPGSMPPRHAGGRRPGAGGRGVIEASAPHRLGGRALLPGEARLGEPWEPPRRTTSIAPAAPVAVPRVAPGAGGVRGAPHGVGGARQAPPAVVVRHVPDRGAPGTWGGGRGVPRPVAPGVPHADYGRTHGGHAHELGPQGGPVAR